MSVEDKEYELSFSVSSPEVFDKVVNFAEGCTRRHFARRARQEVG